MSSVDGKVFNATIDSSVSDASSNIQNGNNAELHANLDGIPGLHYDMSGDKYLIIFNHFEYQNTKYFRKRPSTRNGTHADVKSLSNVFKELDFKVDVYQDSEHADIINVVGKFTVLPHTNTSCVAVAILTHGDAGGQLSASDRPYMFTDVLAPFYSKDCNLVNVPKLFFVQACRGDKVDDGVAYDGQRATRTIPSHADLLILYATVEEYVSWRDSSGSFLIQELCLFLRKYGKQLDILQIITLVNNKVAYTRESYNPIQNTLNRKKQMPETRFTLTKFLKF